jgi:hypothetical protein
MEKNPVLSRTLFIELIGGIGLMENKLGMSSFEAEIRYGSGRRQTPEKIPPAFAQTIGFPVMTSDYHPRMR